MRAESIRLLLLILGGAMRGIYAGGQVCALQAYGLSNVFDVAAGISTGAPAVSFFLASQAELGTSVYPEECTKDFISWCPPSLNADYLAALFRGETGEKMLDQCAVRASRTQLFVGATCAETGNGVWLDAKKTEPDIVQAIRASIAIPGLTGPPVLVGDHPYWDGGGAFPFPLHDVIERFNPTDVLVLANAPHPKKALPQCLGVCGKTRSSALLPEDFLQEQEQPFSLQKDDLKKK